jgi:hypothetical protein
MEDMLLPVSLVRDPGVVVKRPTTRTWSVLNPACIPKALPVRRWQARQLQIETANGSPETSRRSWPQ